MLRPSRLVAVVALGLALTVAPSAAQADPGPWPGLPLIPGAPSPPFFEDNTAGPGTPQDRNLYSWLNPTYNGLAGSTYAKQWARQPIGMLAGNIHFQSCTPPEGDSGGVPCPYDTPEDATAGFISDYDTRALLVSPDGSSKPYGFGIPISVRTVAFGSIPIEVELQVRQTRDAADLPKPAVVTSRDYQKQGGFQVLAASDLTLEATLQVLALRVDGVDVGLGRTCGTSPTTIEATSQKAEYPTNEVNRFNPRREAYGITGGGLEGTMTIPAFRGCGTGTGDDVAPILTSALSGPDNPVFLQYGGTCPVVVDGNLVPVPPGADTPSKVPGCEQFQVDPALNPDLWWIPLPWDIPDVPPGESIW